MRGNGLKPCQGRFRLDFREYSSWKGLSSLEFMENSEFVASGRRAGTRDKDGRKLVREKMGKGTNPNWNQSGFLQLKGNGRGSHGSMENGAEGNLHPLWDGQGKGTKDEGKGNS